MDHFAFRGESNDAGNALGSPWNRGRSLTPCFPLQPAPRALGNPAEGGRGHGNSPQPSSASSALQRLTAHMQEGLCQGNDFSPDSFFMCLLNKIIIDGLIHLSHNQNSSQDRGRAILYHQNKNYFLSFCKYIHI